MPLPSRMFCRYCVVMALISDFAELHYFYCPYEQRFDKRVSLKQLRYKNCHLKESFTGEGAGTATNIRVQCKHDHKRKDKYYTEISWEKPQNSQTPVSSYRIYIQFYQKEQVCFQLPPNQLKFEFNRSVGLIRDCKMLVSVTPQPIARRGLTYISETTTSLQCPISPKLTSLRNAVVWPGAWYMFRTRFKVHPVPSPKVAWYFSADKTNCRHPHLIVTSPENGMSLSNDNLSLTLNKTRREHIGCYVVTADNGIGHMEEQRGYLDFNTTTIVIRSETKYLKIEGYLFISIAGLIVVLLLLTLVVWIYRKSQQRRPSQRMSLLPTKRSIVYLSHCTDNDIERIKLVQFCGVLQSFGIDVVLDICSQVDINATGGLSRWIPTTLTEVDKIVVLITPQYLWSLATTALKDTPDSRCVQEISKVHCEYTIMSTIVYSNPKQANKKILLLCKGVPEEKFSHFFQNMKSINFPEKFDITTDANFRSIVKVLGQFGSDPT